MQNAEESADEYRVHPEAQQRLFDDESAFEPPSFGLDSIAGAISSYPAAGNYEALEDYVGCVSGSRAVTIKDARGGGSVPFKFLSLSSRNFDAASILGNRNTSFRGLPIRSHPE